MGDRNEGPRFDAMAPAMLAGCAGVVAIAVAVVALVAMAVAPRARAIVDLLVGLLVAVQ